MGYTLPMATKAMDLLGKDGMGQNFDGDEGTVVDIDIVKVTIGIL